MPVFQATVSDLLPAFSDEDTCPELSPTNARALADALKRAANLAEVPAWVDRLRCLGNAVVPQQAEAAFLHLLERLP